MVGGKVSFISKQITRIKTKLFDSPNIYAIFQDYISY